MTLEAVVFPEARYFPRNEFYSMGGGPHEFGGVAEEAGTPHSFMLQNLDQWSEHGSPRAADTDEGRRKRPRAARYKNQEEVESQRMVHIAVERNRRKQMNQYLTTLQSLMPRSYILRGDQASIVGGAINYVKELEQFFQSLQARKRRRYPELAALTPRLADFFAFPQDTNSSYASSSSHNYSSTRSRLSTADIEVSVAEGHANLKVLCRKRPKQLLKVVEGLQNLQLTALHLNVTTIDQTVLYSLNLKVEDDCPCTSVDDITREVYQMLGKLPQEED